MYNTDKRQKRIEVLVNQGDLDNICCEQNGNVSIFSTYQTYEVMKVFTKSILKCFGEEYELTGENDLSDEVTVIKTKYSVNGEEGTIALIGPKRMEYDRVISLLYYITKKINNFQYF